MALLAVLGAAACGPDDDPKAEASAAPATTSAAPRPGEVRDQKAHISYVLPQGWYSTPPNEELGLYSSMASTRDAAATASPGATPDTNNPVGTFMVGVVEAETFVAKERTIPEVAEAVARAQLDLIYPAPAKDTVRSSEGTRIDGHNGWLMDVECVPEDTKVAPFRLRVTVIDAGPGAVPIYTLSSAPSSATERFAQIEAIERSVRF